jgi:hypothetical protein
MEQGGLDKKIGSLIVGRLSGKVELNFRYISSGRHIIVTVVDIDGIPKITGQLWIS